MSILAQKLHTFIFNTHIIWHIMLRKIMIPWYWVCYSRFIGCLVFAKIEIEWKYRWEIKSCRSVEISNNKIFRHDIWLLENYKLCNHNSFEITFMKPFERNFYRTEFRNEGSTLKNIFYNTKNIRILILFCSWNNTCNLKIRSRFSFQVESVKILDTFTRIIH